MASPSTSVKHISSVVQHTVELNLDVQLKDSNLRRSSGKKVHSINLPDSKCTYNIGYGVIDKVEIDRAKQ